MARSTGIVLTATALSFTADWVQTDTPNFRIVAAGAGSALFLAGVEKLSPTLGVGLASIMLVTLALTPIRGRSPVQLLVDQLYPPAGTKPFDPVKPFKG